MNNELIFLPVLVQQLLVIALYFKLAAVKKQAVAAGEVDEDRRALFDDAWPPSVIKINNCIRNQFELPLLFYVLVGILWALDGINLLVHGLAWLFVISRLAHAYIQTGSNYVPLRRQFFTVGAVIIIALIVTAVVAILN